MLERTSHRRRNGAIMGNCYRALDTRESQLLKKLLSHDFPGRDELREQVPFVLCRTIDEDGGLSLKCSAGRPAPVLCRVPTEGTCADLDGVQIHVLLHVVDGFVNELEVYKDDSSRVKRSPVAEHLVAFSDCSPPAVHWSYNQAKK
jgi:hypothetical protein